MTADRDQRITTAAAGLAAYRLWLAEHETAWLVSGAPVPFDDRALDQLSQCAEWVLEDLGVPEDPARNRGR